MGIALQSIMALFAIALVWEAIKTYRGVPDKNGRPPNKLMGHVLIVVAAGLVIGAFVAIPRLLEP